MHCIEQSPNDLNSTLRLVTSVNSYTLQAKSLPHPPKSYSATNIGQIVTHLLILEKWKRSSDGCVTKKKMLWPITGAITAITPMNTPEWLSLQSLQCSLAPSVALWILQSPETWASQPSMSLLTQRRILNLALKYEYKYQYLQNSWPDFKYK